MKAIVVASDAKYRKILAGQTLKDLLWFSSLSPAGLTRFLEFVNGESGIERLRPDVAKHSLRFDFGHPVDGCVYVENPCLKGHYFTPADANERLIKEKMGVFLKLAASLGAKKLELLSGQAVKKSWKGEVAVPLPQAAAQVGLSASFGADNTVNRQVCFEWDEPSSTPSIPEGVDGWLNMDPILRNMVESRINHGLRSAQVSLRFEEVLSGCADITAKYGKLGFNVGGSYKDVYVSTWNYSIDYWSRKESN